MPQELPMLLSVLLSLKQLKWDRAVVSGPVSSFTSWNLMKRKAQLRQKSKVCKEWKLPRNELVAESLLTGEAETALKENMGLDLETSGPDIR